MKTWIPPNSFLGETFTYVGRIRQFNSMDWLVYTAWIGMMAGLLFAVGGFFWIGYMNSAPIPVYAWNVPIGTLIFTLAIAFDTIGHRTVYKEVLRDGEALVHHITIFAGITSVVGLILAYRFGEALRIPVLVLIFLSIVYSLVDEVMHWRRYLNEKSDRVEMWSHVFILTGHLIMIVAWWQWFSEGYPGVKETLSALP